jgi:hypothetical protein
MWNEKLASQAEGRSFEGVPGRMRVLNGLCMAGSRLSEEDSGVAGEGERDTVAVAEEEDMMREGERERAAVLSRLRGSKWGAA